MRREHIKLPSDRLACDEVFSGRIDTIQITIAEVGEGRARLIREGLGPLNLVIRDVALRDAIQFRRGSPVVVIGALSTAEALDSGSGEQNNVVIVDRMYHQIP